MHKGRQPQEDLAEQRLLIQQFAYGFQVRVKACLHRKYDALRNVVSFSERNQHPDTGTDLHILGNAVGVGLIDGKIRRRNSNFPDHPSASSFVRRESDLLNSCILP